MGGSAWLRVAVKEWVTQNLQWRKRKLLIHFWVTRDFSVLLLFLSISWQCFQSFPSTSPICSHQPVNAMVTFPLNVTASLPPPETFSFTILDYSASRFQHILNLTAYFQHVEKSNLIPKCLSHPKPVSLISVFRDSILHYSSSSKQTLWIPFFSVFAVDNTV